MKLMKQTKVILQPDRNVRIPVPKSARRRNRLAREFRRAMTKRQSAHLISSIYEMIR